MAALPTYRAQVIVLRKTKLGEGDLILDLLAEDGSQIRAVAKGARKPTSAFASRLELYAVADVLLAGGRSLDIVKEARLVESNEALRRDLEHAAAAAPMAELLDRVTQSGLETPRIFALTQTALASLGRVEAPQAPAVCAAHLLKALAFFGLRPSLDSCACCGRALAPGAQGDNVVFSYREGGVVCSECRAHADAVTMSAAALAWAKLLLRSTFKEVESLGVEPAASFQVLRLCQLWVREHVGFELRSLNFLFTCALY